MSMVIEENIMVPMRDGVKLATDVYRPAQQGQWPVLLTRLPYNKDRRFPFEYPPFTKEKRIFLELNFDSARVVEAGYVIVAQDTRGRFASEGEFEPFVHEVEDGADAITWVASQPWSSGQVGMFGVSYQGLTQWQAAREQPAALRAIAPSQSPGWHVYPYQGGAFLLGVALGWATDVAMEEVQRRVGQGRATRAELEEMRQASGDLPALFRRLPLVDVPLLQGRAPYYFDWLAHPTLDEYWRTLIQEEFYEQVTVPALTIAGWYDHFQREDLEHYQSMRQRGGSALARSLQHLVIGPGRMATFCGASRNEPMAQLLLPEICSPICTCAGSITGSRGLRMVWSKKSRCASLSWERMSGARKRTGRCPIRSTALIIYTAEDMPTQQQGMACSRPRRRMRSRRMSIATIRVILFRRWAAPLFR